MKFMLLLWDVEGGAANATDEQVAQEMARWEEFTKEAVAAGAMVSGEGLQPSTASTTLRLSGGERLLTDGPFAETKEQLGGFYVLECPNLDAALDWAAKMPSAQRGAPIEVRPVIDYEAYDIDAPVSTQEA